MIRHERFFGGAYYEAISSNLALKPGDAKVRRVLCLDPQSADLYVQLPDARELKEGGAIFIVLNLSSTYVMYIRLSGEGSNDQSIGTEQRAVASLRDNSTQAGEWVYTTKGINAAATLRKV